VAREVQSPIVEDAPGAKKRPILTFFKELPVLVALALGIALLIKALLIQAFFIPSASMEPTLRVGDRVLVNKLTYRFHEPRRGDVIVFKDPYGEIRCPPNRPSPNPECHKSAIRRTYDWFAELFGLPTGETKDYIKRIVARPNETLAMQDGDVYVCTCADPVADVHNRVDFAHTTEKGPQKDNYSMPPFHVPADNYYVLGDNRGNSSDSRIFKAISRRKIIGKAFVLLWPPNRFSGL
jgi:signal peptidase I